MFIQIINLRNENTLLSDNENKVTELFYALANDIFQYILSWDLVKNQEKQRNKMQFKYHSGPPLSCKPVLLM